MFLALDSLFYDYEGQNSITFLHWWLFEEAKKERKKERKKNRPTFDFWVKTTNETLKINIWNVKTVQNTSYMLTNMHMNMLLCVSTAQTGYTSTVIFITTQMRANRHKSTLAADWLEQRQAEVEGLGIPRGKFQLIVKHTKCSFVRNSPFPPVKRVNILVAASRCPNCA